ncbi:RNA ligase [Asticcacaulis benevestitus]|uniref:T4 RNA ligase 1-like N-terminal domain-containing protein n=1 Tax=Asticcacaulis benevestitus DSM 16100 = ATCC BAA-896 TaxID=1121022 RepID=V4R8V6_9CAUL|nr:RNA ligase [Asticcacaulis benevestitus]ESQ87873.1 hypothetical protein ABENE_16665 [Asticcacaulis benevestitus DSM 16100 = ATCC BAA-896]
MFKVIQHIDEVRGAVAHRKEIRFFEQPNGLTLGCYMFMDNDTFDTKEALECRGIVFDRHGAVASRPLHKFFNVGEREGQRVEQILQRNDVVAIYDKLDGSMIATAWHDGQVVWRSKKSFDSDVVRLTEAYLADPAHADVAAFAHEVARRGLTAVFELTHPGARIVVPQEMAQLRLLHVRDNVSGAYVLLDPDHEVHGLVSLYRVPRVAERKDLTLEAMFASLETMYESEGYVLQFANGDMAKVKCPWYLRLHRAATLLRERDVASLTLDEELDDLKGALRELGLDLTEVCAIESRIKANLLALNDEIEAAYQVSAHLDQKAFAIDHQGHALFKPLMKRYVGKDIDLIDFYRRNHLREDFSLRSLMGETLAEALDG